MKYILLISTLMFSAGSWAEWTEVFSADGDVIYVELDSIKKAKGLVYYWMIGDNLEPDSSGTLSFKAYAKADCETMRSMALSISTYKLPMAEGDASSTFTPDPKWRSAQPDSVMETTLEAVCNH